MVRDRKELLMKNLLSLIATLSLFLSLNGTPKVVVLLRHGEKKKGTYSSLSKHGQQRAQALTAVFAGSKLPSFLPNKPDFFFATTPHTLFTIGPTAQALGVPVEVYLGLRTDQVESATKQIVDDLLNNPSYQNKIAVVTWEHHNIPVIAKGLGVKDKDAAKWSGKVFDRYWVLTFNNDGTVSFEDLPQNILLTDSKT